MRSGSAKPRARPAPARSRGLGLVVVALLFLAGATPEAAGAAAAGAQGEVLLVRLRSEGPHAVEACAERLTRQGRSFAGATRDRSDSLDALHEALGVRDVRALFRRADAGPLAARRSRARERVARARRRLPERLRDALPPAPDLSPIYRLRLAPGVDAGAAAARYAADPHVVWAQPDFEVVPDVLTDDPFLVSSGAWGQSFGDLWGLHHTGAPAAWDLARGEGVVVAVVDTGVDTAHPDLAANLWVNPGEDLDGDGRAEEHERNGVDDDANGFVDDLHGFDFANSVDANEDGDFDDPGDVSDADPFDDAGHGTHVAGTAAAVGDNGIGVVGVAPRARIMGLKGFLPGASATIETLARAMVYAVDNGARVINNSWSCSTHCPRNPVAEEAAAYATSLGAVVVTSAGNRSDDVVFFSPENTRDTIVVGATNEHDQPTFFTNTGLLVDVVAPGGGDPRGSARIAQRAILSLRSSGALPGATGDGFFVVGEHYLRWSGTSMSAPHVAGAAALVLSARPELTPDEVRAVIRRGARDLGRPGHDARHGAGLLDAFGALAAAPPAVRAAFEQPRAGALLRPQDGPIAIEGSLTGDVASAELSVGAGTDPTSWETLFETLPVGASQRLASWDASGREDGPHVLRLVATGRDGSRVEEFLPLSLERNTPVRLSAPGAAALSPSVAGELVAWQSRRPRDDASDEDGEPPDFDVFVSAWPRSGPSRDRGGRGEDEPVSAWRAVSAPGNQLAPQLDGRRLAWLDGRHAADEVFGCRLPRRPREPAPPCREQVLAAGTTDRNGLVVSDGLAVWTERPEGEPARLRGCRLQGGRCGPLELPFAAGAQSDASLGGGRLAWLDRASGFPRLLTCRLDPWRACVPDVVAPGLAFTRAAVSGDLLAWHLPAPLSPLFACRIDPRTGACPPRQFAVGGAEPHLAASGDRLVWQGPGPGGDLDIFVCEHDRVTDACPVQRITGSAATQRSPAISGARVVWEDDREGAFAIFGLELPSLAPLADRRVRVGRLLVVRVHGRDPSGPRAELALSARFADGASLATRGAHFLDRGDGSGWLWWRPGPQDRGEHAITVEGRGAGGLVTRRSVRIDVLARSAGPPRFSGSRGSR